MAVRTATLNGQTHWPSSIEGGRRKIGEVLDADDGGANYIHLGLKGEWVLTWDKPKESIVTQLQGIYLLTGTFSATIDGTTYTVFVPPDGFQRTMRHLDSRSANATVFTVTMTLREA